MPGTTNFIQWNPTSANQETDSEYQADSQRAGGAVNPQFFDAALANKLFYQISTSIAALNQMLANKNISVSDADLATLTTQYAKILTTADVKPAMVSASFASTLSLDCSTADGFEVVLTGNVTSLTLANAATYQQVTLTFVQDATGGRTVAFPSNVKSPGTVGPGANATSTQVFQLLADGNFHPVTPMVVS